MLCETFGLLVLIGILDGPSGSGDRRKPSACGLWQHPYSHGANRRPATFAVAAELDYIPSLKISWPARKCLVFY
jgi:hypothetical protein